MSVSHRSVSKTSRPVADAFALRQKSARAASGLALVEGPQALEYAIRVGTSIRQVFVAESALSTHTGLLEKLTSATEVLLGNDQVIDKLADTRNPQGIIALAEWQAPPLHLAGARLAVLLEHANDPGNAGTIVRTADAAGAQAVIFGPDSVEPTNPKVVRASAGSVFGLPPVQADSVESVIQEAKAAGMRVVGTHLRGALSLFDPEVRHRLASPTLWVLGNEARGMTDDTAHLCDELVMIPIFGHAESLNLAAAAAVCLYTSADLLPKH